MRLVLAITAVLLAPAVVGLAGGTAAAMPLGMIVGGETLERPAAEYVVRIAAADPRTVHVTVCFAVAPGKLSMSPEGADGIEGGWTRFVDALEARDARGAAVPLRSAGTSTWKLGRRPGGPLTLGYRVAIRHDEVKWPFGHDEAAYARPDCLFFVGRALFVAPEGLGRATVRFELPRGWRVSTPWASAGPGTYHVAGRDELLDVCMLAGAHEERTVRVGGIEIVLALGRSVASAADLFESAVAPVTRAASELFGGAPHGKYVVVVNKDVYDGGGAFTRSISMLFKEVPGPESRAVWGHVLAHEITHLWNGHTIRPADQPQAEWFVEGFTEYLSNLAELRAGAIDRSELLGRLGRAFDAYRAVAGKLSLRRAGVEKDENYDLVYTGGLTAAFALDVEMRGRTGLRRGLPDLMRRLYAEAAATGRRHTVEEIAAAASAVAGADLSGFFARYVDGAEVIPAERYAAAAGLEPGSASGESRAALGERATATAAERALLASILDPAAAPVAAR